MKKLLMMVLVQLMVLSAAAQMADYQKAVAKYKKFSTATATVVKIKHNKALKQDMMTSGTLTMKKPNQVSIECEGGKDALIMDGSTFTMVLRGRKHTTTSTGNPQFATFQAVFESILSGAQNGVDLKKFNDLKVTKDGNTVVLTITPETNDKKLKRRIMFSTLILTIDTKTSELKSLRLNERKGGYTDYAFSNFKFK